MPNFSSQRLHLIAIGGSAMHNLALALAKQGHKVSGSDDQIFEPSASRLAHAGLFPAQLGWFAENISADLDMVIVGMHARADNPELLAATALGLKIYSFPEYIYNQCQDKQRIVIAGSHGKTTITAMIMHALKQNNRKFDYLAGAQLDGFEQMVGLSEDAPIAIIEGDEYLCSAIDPSPKFLKYHHHIGVVSGIAWDHINVFESQEAYVRQFDHFADATPKAGILIYNGKDALASVICKKERADVQAIEYNTHPHEIINGQTYLIDEENRTEVPFFGVHNMQNVAAAKEVCMQIGLLPELFYQAMRSFKGASGRLELLAQNTETRVYKDFAHAPSKVKATVKALKKQFPERELVACLELHTYSSLNKDFLPTYANAFETADLPIVFYDPAALTHKKLDPISDQIIIAAFADARIQVFSSIDALLAHLSAMDWKNKNLLMMSSGSFSSTDLAAFANKIIK